MDEEPAPSTTGKSLPDVIFDEEVALLFRDYLRSRHGGENLGFWVEVELFRAMKGRPHEVIEQRALDIFAKYLRIGCAHEINIDQETRLTLLKEMSNVQLDLFDEAQREIRALLETDCIPKFRQEPAYINLMEARKKKAGDKKGRARRDDKRKSGVEERMQAVLKLFHIKDSHNHSLHPNSNNSHHSSSSSSMDAQKVAAVEAMSRGRQSTVSNLAAWRESRVQNSSDAWSFGTSPTNTTAVTLAVSPPEKKKKNSPSISPSRPANSHSPPAAASAYPEEESTLSLSAPNPTGHGKKSKKKKEAHARDISPL